MTSTFSFRQLRRALSCLNVRRVCRIPWRRAKLSRRVVISLYLAIAVLLTIYQFNSQSVIKMELNEYLSFAGRQIKVKKLDTATQFQSFLTICRDFGIQVFLVEPGMIRQANKTGIVSLGENIVTLLGVNADASLLQENSSFMKKLKSQGMQASWMTVRNPVLSSQVLKTHLFLKLSSKSNSYIHLSIFHKRHDKYFWIGPLNPTDIHFAPTTAVNPALKFPAAFEIFSIAEIGNTGVYLPTNPTAFIDSLESSSFMECNQTRVETFKKNMVRNNSTIKSSKLIKAKIRSILLDTKKILDSVNMKFWLIGGTLLGWYRECSVIPDSEDADVGVWMSEYNPRLLSTLRTKKHPIKLWYEFGKKEEFLELAVWGHGIKLDISFFYVEKDCIWTGGVRASARQKVRWVYPLVESLCRGELLGELFYVPCNTEEILVASYGPQWFHPIASNKYIWDRSPHNIQEMGSWSEEEHESYVKIYSVF